MSCSLMRAVLVSAAFLSLIVAGCSRTPARIKVPKVDAAAAAAEAMAMCDADKDGKISGDEFDQCSSLKAIARNGEVTADMLANLFDLWQKGDIGRVNVGVRIVRNGQPMANASVKLRPEKFMGTDIQPATGTTNANGISAVSVPVAQVGVPRGASLGFYRIEVTKDGESIPAKYNTESVLCLAVLDMINSPPTFNLVY
jgi:hypothetical protein